MKPPTLKNTPLYQIQNEGGDIYWSLTPPDYIRTRLVDKATLEGWYKQRASHPEAFGSQAIALIGQLIKHK